MNTSIKVTHKGEDYFEVEIDGKEYDVNVPVGNLVINSINNLIELVQASEL